MISETHLRDLPERRTLHFHCNARGCGYSVELNVAELKLIFGDDCRVDELRRRAKCRKCGSKDNVITAGYGDDFDPAGYSKREEKSPPAQIQPIPGKQPVLGGD